MPKTITLEWLKEHYACEDQIEIFLQVFGNSAELNEANAAKALEAGLDLDWFARHILTPPARDEFERVRATALEEFNRVRATAMEEFNQVRAIGWAAYERDGDWQEYDRIKVPAWAEYSRVVKTALAEYERLVATAILSLIK